MARVVWSDEALRALDAIAAYLDEVAPARASDLIDELRASVCPLLQFPRMGRIVPELERDTLRELVVDRYRVIYEITDDGVAVVTVYHSAMDVGKRLRELRPFLG